MEAWSPVLRSTADLVLAHGFPMILLWGEALTQIYNDAYGALMGDKHPRGLGQATAECWPEVWHINSPLYERVWRGETLTFEDKLYPLERHGALDDVWLTLTYSPVRENGEVAGVLVTIVETTPQHAEAEQRRIVERARQDATTRLRASEARLSALVASLPLGVAVIDGDGEVVFMNPQMRRYTPTGVLPSRDPDRLWRWRAVDADGRAVEAASFPGVRALRGEPTVPGLEMAYIQDDGCETWVSVTAAPILDDLGQVTGQVVAVADIDALKRSEQALRKTETRQQVLLAELQHRTRNLIAIVRAISEKTARSSRDLADFSGRFRLRLEALARVQGLFSRLRDDERITLETLIRTELSAVVGGFDRIALEGAADVGLDSVTVQILALAFHELATNAVKYGALNKADGRLHIRWTLEPSADGPPTLAVTWRESGVDMSSPGRSKPEDRQGRELILKALPYQLQAQTEHVLGPDGVVCTIKLPLSDA